MTIQSADYTAFKQFATFQSVDELNLTIRRFLYAHSHELTSATIQTLKTISRFSCKLLGVCWTKVATIAQTAEISERTVRRAIAKLEEYGIIKRIPTQRKQGGDGHNIYVIQPVTEGIDLPVTPSVSADLSERQSEENTDGTSTQHSKTQNETVSCETEYSSRDKDSNNVKKPEPTLEQLDASYTPKHIPEEFINAVKPFVGNAYAIYRLWGMVCASMRNMSILDVSVDVIIDAWKQSVFAYKAKRKRLRRI